MFRERREAKVRSVVEPLLAPEERVEAVSMCLIGPHPMVDAMKDSARRSGVILFAPKRFHLVVTDRRLLILGEDARTAKPLTDGHIAFSLSGLQATAAEKQLVVEHHTLGGPLVLFFPRVTRSQLTAIAAALNARADVRSVPSGGPSGHSGRLRLRVMADYDCWPLWNDDDPNNVDPESLPISPELLVRLERWQQKFDDILDRDEPAASPGWGSAAAKAAFEAEGRRLAIDLQRELGPGTPVRYWRDSWDETPRGEGIYDANHPVAGMPNPGSDPALEAGCSCPPADNDHGRLVGGMGFYIAANCRLHGPDAGLTPPGQSSDR